MPAAQLANAGIPGPIPDDFDFDMHIRIPDGINQPELPFPMRVSHNVAIEDHNNESVFQTLTVKSTAGPRPENLDIGPPLKAPYCYTPEEFSELVESPELCASLAPLPSSLIRLITSARRDRKLVAEQARQTGKEKEKETTTRTKLLGTMKMTTPVQRTFGQPKSIIIPTIYLFNLKNRMPPPLHFFQSSKIDLINHSPKDVPLKYIRPFGLDNLSPQKVHVLDLEKMVVNWGNDDTSECLSPLRFLEASRNLHKALNLLSPDPTDGEPTFANEYRKHYQFFESLDDMEDTFQYWYDFEREARYDLLLGNVLYDENRYATQVGIVLQARLAATGSFS
ncbi:hypothetical protein H0H93_015375 [Arthromyces matolae]|nr:hypothetical protein H0H93_015375 [Arthromyces matolae]